MKPRPAPPGTGTHAGRADRERAPDGPAGLRLAQRDPRPRSAMTATGGGPARNTNPSAQLPPDHAKGHQRSPVSGNGPPRHADDQQVGQRGQGPPHGHDRRRVAAGRASRRAEVHQRPRGAVGRGGVVPGARRTCLASCGGRRPGPGAARHQRISSAEFITAARHWPCPGERRAHQALKTPRWSAPLQCRSPRCRSRSGKGISPHETPGTGPGGARPRESRSRSPGPGSRSLAGRRCAWWRAPRAIWSSPAGGQPFRPRADSSIGPRRARTTVRGDGPDADPVGRWDRRQARRG